MSKHLKWSALVLVLIVLYGIFIFWTGRKQDHGTAPEISAPESVLTISVNDGIELLLQDVAASDKEDGDLTSQVYIESISTFDENQERTITYAVFDTDDHLVRTTRKMKYSDYQAPIITVEKPLCFNYYTMSSVDVYKDYVSAYSVIDGDISSRISIESETLEESMAYVVYVVSDSSGTKTSMRLKVDLLNMVPNIEITLSEYMVRVEKGTEIHPEDYLTQVKLMGVVDQSLLEDVAISSDYDPYTAGTYEFIYRLSLSGGEYGMTKLVVVVE